MVTHFHFLAQHLWAQASATLGTAVPVTCLLQVGEEHVAAGGPRVTKADCAVEAA